MTNLPTSKVMTAPEEKALNKQIQELKDVRDEVEIVQGVQPEVKDKTVINRKIAELEEVRRTQSVPELSETDRSMALKELQLLTDDLRKGMPRWDIYVGLTPKDGARYTSLVKWITQAEADPVRRSKIKRWKMLRRMVDPADPQAGDIRYLYPQD